MVLGPNSRMVMEFRDDALQMFYILDIVNNARTRVDIGGPLIIDLPEGAGGATVLEGSSPTATVSGDRLTVTGPFAAGATSVQVAFRLTHTGPNLDGAADVARRAGAAHGRGGEGGRALDVVAAVLDRRRSQAADGTPFLLASGPALPAGSTLTVQISNLPAHSQVPRRSRWRWR